MTLRTVTPANGAAQLTINWDGGSSTVTAGQVVDIPAGGALESAYGLTNLTALTGTALAADQGGLDPSATGNQRGCASDRQVSWFRPHVADRRFILRP